MSTDSQPDYLIAISYGSISVVLIGWFMAANLASGLHRVSHVLILLRPGADHQHDHALRHDQFSNDDQFVRLQRRQYRQSVRSDHRTQRQQTALSLPDTLRQTQPNKHYRTDSQFLSRR